MADLYDFEKVHRNLYKKAGFYYKLFALSITPNGCWLVAPFLLHLVDIDIATGKDVFGEFKIEFEFCGTIPGCNEYITNTNR